MADEERLGVRCLCWSRWHREPNLPHEAAYIDIDGCEYCRQCKEPVFLIETAHKTGKPKATTVLRALAKRAGISAYLVRYEGCMSNESNVDIQQVWPWNDQVVTMTGQAMRDYLLGLRIHNCDQADKP